MLTGFETGQSRVKPMLLKLRNLDSEIGHASVEMIDLLDEKWGELTCDSSTGQLLSDDEC